RQLARGKGVGVVLVVLAPIVQLPVELERSFLVLDHELPLPDELRAIPQALDNRVGVHSEETLDRLVESASGLTRTEAENAFALSLVRKDRFDPEVVWEICMFQQGGNLGLAHGVLPTRRSRDGNVWDGILLDCSSLIRPTKASSQRDQMTGLRSRVPRP